MIETEEQRRWWFATHPEYSSSHKGKKNRKRTREKTAAEKNIPPEQVDAYVDDALQYLDGPVAELLKSTKRHFGTEGHKGKLVDRFSDAPTPSLFRSEREQANLPPAPFEVDFRNDVLGQRFALADVLQSPPRDELAENGESGTREATFGDAVRKGFNESVRFLIESLGLGGSLARPSRTLARNLERVGRPRPPDHDPHHIVSARDNRFEEATKARKFLSKFKIDINDPANGVWLPNKPDIGSGAYHRALHSRENSKKIYKLLRGAKNRDHAIKILKQIGRQLSNNTFH